MFQVPDHADRTGLVVEHNHGAGTHAAARLLHFGKVHGDVQMLFHQKVRRSAAGEQPAKSNAVAHASRVLLQNFPDSGAHGQFPEARPFHFAAGAVELRPAILAAAQASEPSRRRC